MTVKCGEPLWAEAAGTGAEKAEKTEKAGIADFMRFTRAFIGRVWPGVKRGSANPDA